MLPPQGCHLYSLRTGPSAYALAIHDLKEQRPAAIDLFAQLLAGLGVQLLVCSLRHAPQPIASASLQAVYEWLAEHHYKPQIAIGIGLGAHLQHQLDWTDCWAMAHIDAPGVQSFAAATHQDLFNSPHVAVAGGSVQIDPATASRVLGSTASNAQDATPQLWLGMPDRLDLLQLPASASRLQIAQSLAEDGLVYARLLCAWIQGQMPGSPAKESKPYSAHSLPVGQLQVEARINNGEQIELRTGEMTFASAAENDASVQLLLVAIAHASLVELRDVIYRLGWEMPKVQVSVRSTEALPFIDQMKQGDEQQDQEQQPWSCIRDIHILQGMDEVRKNLLHQQLQDSIMLAGVAIPLINRLR